MKWYKTIKGLLMFYLVLSIVCLTWYGLEWLLDGAIINQYSDSVFAFILSSLLTEKVYKVYLVYENAKKKDKKTTFITLEDRE